MQLVEHTAKSVVRASREFLARMLCYGLCLPRNVPTDYLCRHGLEPDFIHGSVFMVNGNKPINTAVLDSTKKSSLAIPLSFDAGQLWAETNGGRIPCPPLSQPPSIHAEFEGYGRISRFFKLHSPSTVFATPVRECIFGAIGKPCQFCTFEMARPKPLPPKIFSEMLKRVVGNRKNLSLAIGPGTPNQNDHGARYVNRLLEETRAHWDGPISVEIVPPHNLNDLPPLFEAGVGSIIMSIELWDDARREVVCPGKSYVSKSHYLEAWRLAVGQLGRGKVSSVLLVGLDTEASLTNGIKAMTEMGVVPTLIPFRPYSDIALTRHPSTDHRMYLEMTEYNIRMMAENNIGPRMQVGCTACGGCSLDIEK